MPKQKGNIRIGTFEGRCYYQLYGQYYVRRVSSLTARRFKHSQAFEGARQASRRFGAASSLAGKAYRSVCPRQRRYALFLKLKKLAMTLLHQHHPEAEVATALQQYLDGQGIRGMDSPGRALKPKEGAVVKKDKGRAPALVRRMPFLAVPTLMGMMAGEKKYLARKLVRGKSIAGPCRNRDGQF